MILIHLAKAGLLEDSCDYFSHVAIPEAVFLETVKVGKEKGFPDAVVIEQQISSGNLKIIKIKQQELIKKANQFNIFDGEAEAVALYWQEKATLLATDDENVRNKKEMLKISVVGTPAIIMEMFRSKRIDASDVHQAILVLKKNAWFNSTTFDKMRQEIDE